MSYTTPKSFLVKYDPEKIGLMTDDASGEEALDNIIQDFLNQAGDFIDTYLRNRYTLPLVATHHSVRRAEMIIARHDLGKRRGEDVDVVDLEYDEILAWLEKLRDGGLDLGGETIRTDTAAYMDSETNIYTEDEFTAY